MLGDLLPPFSLCSVVLSSKRDVMHRTSPEISVSCVGIDQQIDMLPKRLSIGGKTEAIGFLSDFLETHHAQDALGIV